MNVRALTNDQGIQTDTYDYTAFGEIYAQTGTTENNYLYTGQQYDSATKLYSLRARYYDPSDGRFLTQDTYAYDYQNPIELNRYVYGANNPTTYYDPTGHFAMLGYASANHQSTKNSSVLSRVAYSLDQYAWNISRWIAKMLLEHPFLSCLVLGLMLDFLMGIAGRSEDEKLAYGFAAGVACDAGAGPGVTKSPAGTSSAGTSGSGGFGSAGSGGFGSGGGGLTDDFDNSFNNFDNLFDDFDNSFDDFDNTFDDFDDHFDNFKDDLDDKFDDFKDDFDNHKDDFDNTKKNPDDEPDVKPPFCSFSSDTEVATKDGSIPIGELKEGDKVLAYNEATGETGEYEVTAIWSHKDEVVLLTIDGEVVETTNDHPFYTQEQGWTAVEDLEAGFHVRRADGSYGVVEAVSATILSQPMFNLTVDEAHTYFVGDGDWLVHNACYEKIGYDDNYELSRIARKYRIDNPHIEGRPFIEGDVAVFKYRNSDGSYGYEVARNTPFGDHAEVNVANALKRKGIGAEQVVEIYSELRPCTGCTGFIETNYPKDVKVFYSFEYTPKGVEQLRFAIGKMFDDL